MTGAAQDSIPASTSVIGLRGAMAYGAPGFAIAFVALPLYIVLPHHYAAQFGAPLAGLGAVLLASRLVDALVDPFIGRFADRLFAQSPRHVLATASIAAVLLVLGFSALFFPPTLTENGLLGWAAAGLVVTCLAYSMIAVLHQAWAAALGGDERAQARLVGMREALGLMGVLAAASLPSLAGMGATTVALAISLAIGLALWRSGPRPARHRALQAPRLLLPFRRPEFRPLLAVFMANGIAAAIPATLVLFFIEDRLGVPSGQAPLFLGAYFLAAASAIALWVRLVPRLGLARTWLMGMLASVAVFAFAYSLGKGDAWGFLVVCIASGAVLGADLALPGAMLAGVIERAGDRGVAEGAYFGWWTLATKLNLALAAGATLPLLAWAGYAPGARDPEALRALSAMYCLLPCALKLAAAALLYLFFVREDRSRPFRQPEVRP